MNGKTMTYGQLHELLLGLHFETMPVRPSWKAYRHASSGTLILLANWGRDLPARGTDLVSVRRCLAESGLLDAAEFDKYMAAAA